MTEMLNGKVKPDSWEWITVDEIATSVTKGSTPTSYGYAYQSSGINFVRTENIAVDGTVFSVTTYIDEDANEYLRRSKLLENDIMFSIAGTIGRVGIIRQTDLPANTNQALAIIRYVQKHILPYYLFYVLRSPLIQQKALEQIVGVGRANVSLANVREFPLPLAPFNEQHRIVDAIETQFTRLDAAVSALKRTQANLKRYRASVLKAACEGRLVPTEAELAQEESRTYEPASVLLERILIERRRKWEEDAWQKEVDKAKQKAAKARRKADGRPLKRGEKLDPTEWQTLPEDVYGRYLPKNDKWKEKYKEPEPPDVSDLPELPEGWVWTTTGLLCDCIVPNRDKPKSFSGGIPWITLPDFNDQIYIVRSKSGLGLTPDEVTRYRAKVIPKGSVIMSCVGRFGITAVLSKDAVINQQLHAFLIPKRLSNRYFVNALRYQTNTMESMATATTVAYLNQAACNSVPIPLPPLAEQHRIVEEVERRLSIAEQMEKTVEADLARAERLRQSILKRAFEGKLVPQDPNDEPASILLERIQAERNSQPV